MLFITLHTQHTNEAAYYNVLYIWSFRDQRVAFTGADRVFLDCRESADEIVALIKEAEENYPDIPFSHQE